MPFSAQSIQTPTVQSPTRKPVPPAINPAMFDVRMDTAKLGTLDHDIRMDTAKFPPGMVPDVKMETARGLPAATLESTVKKFSALKLWEREALESPEVKRKATVAQLCRL